jgi:hypothetical protein
MEIAWANEMIRRREPLRGDPSPAWPRARALCVACAVALCLSAGAERSAIADDDIQLWTTARVDRSLTDRWAGQFAARFRFDDDVSRAKDFMLRSWSHWRFGDFDLGLGYDYLYDFTRGTTIEHRPFQTLEHRWLPEGPTAGDLTVKNRVRLDERVREDADGLIVRLRYRLRLTREIHSGWYLAVSNEVFANLNDRGSGPVYGFEQNRLGLASGKTIVPGIRAEFGYEWQHSAGRDREDIERHVFFLTLSGAPQTFREGRGD